MSRGARAQAMRAGTVAALLEGAASAEQLAWISSEAAAPAPAAASATPQGTAEAGGGGGAAAAEEAGGTPSALPVCGADAAKDEAQPAGEEEGGADNHAALADFLLGATAGGQPLSAAHYGCMAAYCQVGPSQPRPAVHIELLFHYPVRSLQAAGAESTGLVYYIRILGFLDLGASAYEFQISRGLCCPSFPETYCIERFSQPAVMYRCPVIFANALRNCALTGKKEIRPHTIMMLFQSGARRLMHKR